MCYLRKEEGDGKGSLKDRNLTNHNRVQKLLRSHSCVMSQLWGTCHKAGMLHTKQGRSSENTLYPNILSSLPIRLPSSHDGSHGLMCWRLRKKLDTPWQRGEKRHLVQMKQLCISSMFASLSKSSLFGLFTAVILECYPKCPTNTNPRVKIS